MSSEARSSHVIFDPTAEIFATDNSGRFHFPLELDGERLIDTQPFDEVRFVLSVWHPSTQRSIDLDQAYVELCGSLDPAEGHWIKLAEIEPVVPPFNSGSTFDGWIVLPILAATSSFSLNGSGFEPRARVQIRSSAYFVS